MKNGVLRVGVWRKTVLAVSFCTMWVISFFSTTPTLAETGNRDVQKNAQAEHLPARPMQKGSLMHNDQTEGVRNIAAKPVHHEKKESSQGVATIEADQSDSLVNDVKESRTQESSDKVSIQRSTMDRLPDTGIHPRVLICIGVLNLLLLTIFSTRLFREYRS